MPSNRRKLSIPVGWFISTPFIVKLLLTFPILNTISWSPFRLFCCFDYGKLYHKILSVLFLALSLSPLALVDTFYIIFIKHDAVLFTDL